MVKYLTKKCKQNRGFTLMEVMVVVAILAVIVMIAVPSVISMRKNMQFTQRNDYAKSIFMAAQSNLTEMRSTGLLGSLSGGTGNAAKAQEGDAAGTPPANYVYTWNGDTSYFDYVLPVNSIDSSVRNGQVIIEYNPAAGIVYSVFYYDGNKMTLSEEYGKGELSRDEETRKEDLDQLGYYSVGNIDALDAQELNVYRIATSLTYTNAQEGTVTVMIPTQSTENSEFVNIYEDKIGGISNYVQRMEIALTFTGENSGTFRTVVKEKDTAVTYTAKDIPGVSGASTIIHIDFPLDSLKSGGSFTEIAENKKAPTEGSLTTAPAIAPGDNVSITAEVTFYPDADDPIVMIESATLAGINPMYHSLTQNPEYTDGSTTVKPYILAISNARHLQNLDYLDGTFAQNIESIVFVAQTEEDTVTNSGTGGTGGSGTDGNTSGGTSNGSDSNSDSSKEEGNSAQVLTVSDTNTNTNSGNTTEGENVTPVNTEIAIDLKDIDFTPIDFSDNFTTTDKIPKIIGNGVKISNLNINTPEKADHTGLSTGMFTELTNASIEGIQLIDPIVTNESAALTTNAAAFDEAAATGALIGTADGVTVKDCSVTSTAETSYISGKQLVGGLVGYAKGSSKFVGCSVVNTTIQDIAKDATQQDNIAYVLGGMVGYADGVEFNTCDTTAAVHGLAATKTDLGGLVGKAVSTTLTDCTTKATVSGVDEYLCNAGGLVGYASNTTFSNCDAVSSNGLYVTVESGEYTHYSAGETKNTLGGLVGYAEGTTAAPTKFTNCNISKETTVTSSNYANSDLGGLVGYAKGVAFKTCSSNASVNGTVKVDKEGNTKTDIPNNNLGGFVGYSEGSTYNDIDVNLKDRPEYAMDMGGFAGILKGGSVNDLNVTFEIEDDDDSNTDTITNFGGISSRCNESAAVTNAAVIIKGVINNIKEKAAGAFAFAGGDSAATLTDVRVNLTEATISSAQTAGLIVHHGSNASVKQSYVRGMVSGDTVSRAGFIFQNDGTIDQCFTTVIMSQGNAFVAVNNSTIKNCYGWVWDSSSNVNLAITSKCSHSYFINGKTGAMILYEGLKDDSISTISQNILDTDALTDIWAVELLNKGSASDTPAWKEGSSTYPYPTLTKLSHVGDWEEPESGNYPYGLIYEETYADGNKGYLLTNLYGSVTPSNMPTLDNSEAIKSTAFYLYHRTDDALKEGDNVLAYNNYSWLTLNRLYSIYKLDADNYEIDKVSFNTYYPLSNDGSYYCIRTADQFADISKNSGKTFVIERSIAPTAGIGTFTGSLSASSGVTIDASELSGNLFESLSGSGTLSGLTVTGLTEPMVGTVSGGTISGCVLTNVDIKSGTDVGAIAGEMSSGSISNVTASGSVSGSGNVGGAIGEVSGGTVSDVTVNVFVSASGDNAKAGMFVGYAESGTFNKCSASDENSAFPFANFPARQTSISDKAEYVSIYNHTANSDSTPPTAPMYLTADRFSMAAIEDTNLTLITSDVSVTSCKLNGTLVSITPVYYYSISELKCAIESYMTVITTEERDPSFDSIDTSETGYYIYISEDNYAKITSTNIKEETDAEGNTTYSFSYRTENMTDEASDIVINNISSKSDKVSKYGLKLYRRTVKTPDNDTYLLFDSTGDNILIHNENGYSWEKYSEITKYYSHMVWSYKDGVFTNEYDSTTVTIGDPTSSKTYNITYDGKTVESRLYPVDAYQTVTLEDTANAFNTSLSK